jgi:hypothetical protein
VDFVTITFQSPINHCPQVYSIDPHISFHTNYWWVYRSLSCSGYTQKIDSFNLVSGLVVSMLTNGSDVHGFKSG